MKLEALTSLLNEGLFGRSKYAGFTKAQVLDLETRLTRLQRNAGTQVKVGRITADKLKGVYKVSYDFNDHKTNKATNASRDFKVDLSNPHELTGFESI